MPESPETPPEPPAPRSSSDRAVVGGAKRSFNWSVRNPVVMVGIVVFGLCGLALLLRSFALTPASQYQFAMKRGSYSLAAIAAHNYPKVSFNEFVQASPTKVNTSPACTKAWAQATNIPHSIKWTNADVFCWNEADGVGGQGGWFPQGITGSGSAESTEARGNKNLLVVSWYNANSPAGLAAPTQAYSGDEAATRISVVDTVTKKYQHIELVKPCRQSTTGICKLNSHAGGIAWAGSYLYVASTNGFYVFNINDARIVNGKAVLPASQKWLLDSNKRNGEANVEIASVSLDRTVNPAQLVTVEYRPQGDYFGSKVLRWNLQTDNTLSSTDLAKTASEFDAPARYLQGAASWHGSYLLNSSTTTIGGQADLQAVYRLSGQRVTAAYRLPARIPESLYIDGTHQTVWTVDEGLPPGGATNIRFVYSYPLSAVL